MVLHVEIFFIYFVFVVKQKTAYEMRISDWSSDVCSSDLLGSSAEILVDAYYADRDGDQWIQSTLVSKTLQSTGAKSRGINPALIFYLPNEMSLRFYGAFGRHESRSGNTFFRAAEHTSELTSLMRISYAVFCLKT